MKRTQFNLPSVNHLPYNPKKEIPILESAIVNYLKSALVTPKEIQAILGEIKNDPFVIDKEYCDRVIRIWMPGKKFRESRDRASATLIELTKCYRTTFF